MKTLLRVWLFFVLVCVRFSANAETKEVYDVSIIQLIAAPREYAHKTVRVMGFLGFEAEAIFLHEEDSRRGLLNNGLSIRAEPEIRKRLEKLSGQYVLIRGVVDASFSDVVAVSTFRISLTRITRADAWKIGPSPTTPP